MKRKLQVLTASCILIVSILTLIQYYLIRNTYNLIENQYYREVKLSLAEVLSLPVLAQRKDSTASYLKNEADNYVNRHFSREKFLQDFRAYNKVQSGITEGIIRDELRKYPNLKGVAFKSQCEQIMFKSAGSMDTVLFSSDPPVIFVGYDFPVAAHSSPQWSRSDEFVTQTTDIGTKAMGLIIKGSDYIDISNMQSEVFKRMAGIFTLAVSMILAISILFYWMIRTMLKQKKMADIKTDFANNITHELKTPLSSANIITRSLQKKEIRDQPAVFDEMLASLKRQHKKIHKIVDTVMDSAMAIDETVDLEELNIREYLSAYLPGFPVGNRKLVRHVEETAVILKTDRAKLESILNNLLENALKYSAGDLPVYFSSYVSGKEYVIEIKDFGIGIDKSEQVKIFDQFYRVPQKDKNDVRGLGLGLYLCCKKAMLIHANLSVASKPGQGSVFTLKLPLHGI